MSSPVYITQRTAPDVLGITGRRFREMVIRHRIKHARDGKLVLVRLDAWDEAMARLSASGQVDPAANDAVPMTLDAMLERVGYCRKAGGAR